MKLKFLILLLCIFNFFLSCTQEKIKLQIPDEEMIKILTDLHISEAAILSLNQRTKDSISNIYYQQIFEIHGVTDSVFYSDLKILRNNAERLEAIYQEVMVEIEHLDVKKVKTDSVETSPKSNE
jgi:hypothetical protein